MTWGGGPHCRFWAQSDENNNVKKDLFADLDGEIFKENIGKLDAAVEDLNEGRFLNRNGDLSKTLSDYNVVCVGPVSSLTFAPLCCFIGLATSKQAVRTAKLSKPNTSKTGYLPRMKKFLEEKLKETKSDPSAMSTDQVVKMWTSVATSLIDVLASIKNVCCACFRTKKRVDIFFYGQDIYNLFGHSDAVFVKRWGTTDWVELIYM